MSVSVKLVLVLSILQRSAFHFIQFCILKTVLDYTHPEHVYCIIICNIGRGKSFIALNELNNVNKIETYPINVLNHNELENY